MRKLLSILLTLALCIGLLPLAAVPVHAVDDSVTVYDGTAVNDAAPSSSAWKYYKTQYVISSDSLSDLNGKAITALKWYSADNVSDRKVQIILSETDDSSLSMMSDVSAEHVAYSGGSAWTVDKNGEILITFDRPYAYNGRNLLVTVLDITGAAEAGNSFYSGMGFNKMVNAYSNDAPVGAEHDIGAGGGFYVPKTTLFYAPIETYGLYIAGTQVTSVNAKDLSVIDGVSGTVSYDAASNTLTLSDAAIKGDVENTIRVETAGLTIAFSGTNTITARTSSGYCRGIDAYLYGTLTFAGEENATLTVETTHNNSQENGAIRGDSLLVTGGTVICSAPEAAKGSPKHVPYAISLNDSSDALSVTGGKLICKGWAPLAFAVDTTSIDGDTILYGSPSYDGSNLESYDYDNNGGWASSGWQNTYRYVEATPLLPITVFLESDGGTVSPESLSVTPGGTYGELPEPKKDGFVFDGWVLCEGGGNRLIAKDYYTSNPLFRLATSPGDKAWDAHTESNFKEGNTVVFDVTFNDTVPRKLDVNDCNVDSSLYTIEDNRIYGRIEITDNYINGKHHFVDIVTQALTNDYTVDKFYVIDPNSTKTITADSTVEMTESHALLAKWVPAYSVAIGPGKNMTLLSGTEKQTVTDGTAITSVVYTADDGYYFPTDYNTTPVNGIGTTRDSYTQITVSGMPTDNTTFYPADATAKMKPDAPSAAATDCTTEDNNDGTITGVDSTMEYQKSGDTDWTAITGSTVEGLAPGTYSVRVKATDTALASDTVNVTIAEYVPLPKVEAPTFDPADGKTFEDSIEVTISCVTTGAAIYYTLDGTDPTEASTLTTGAAITLTDTTTLKAIAVMDGYENSEIATAKYTKSTPSTGGGRATTYAVTPGSAENGEITVSPKRASKGSTVTVTVTPDEGYELDTLTVRDKDGNEIKVTENEDGTFTITMPAAEIEVEATFKEAEETPGEDGFPFVDVPEDAYYRKPVEWAVENGITSGVSEDKYGPELSCTRAQVVTFLWITCGSEDAGTETGFDDVDVEAYYDKAVAWAVEKGITAGTSENEFSPDVTVTRAQFVTMLWAAKGKPEPDGEMPFKDVPEDAYYAKAVAWAYANDITAGKSADSFAPDDPCTRGQIMTFLYNAYAE